MEDWYFEEGPFLEFAARALHLLAGLLRDSTELETQLQVCSLYSSFACLAAVKGSAWATCMLRTAPARDDWPVCLKIAQAGAAFDPTGPSECNPSVPEACLAGDASLQICFLHAGLQSIQPYHRETGG